MRTAGSIVTSISQTISSGAGRPVCKFEGEDIEGALDLRHRFDCGPGSIGALIFEDCKFLGEVDLRNNHFLRLSFKNCRIGTLLLDECQIEGSIDLEEINPIDGADAARVSAVNVRIDGDLKLKRAKLSAGPFREPEDRQDFRPQYALNLAQAEIHGSVLCEKAILKGGLNLGAAHVFGDVWLIDSQLMGVEAPALNLQSTTIDGLLVVRDTRTGAEIKSHPTIVCNQEGRGIAAAGGRFRNNVNLEHVVVAGNALHFGIHFHGCEIGQDLLIEGGSFSEGLALLALTIHGKVQIGASEKPKLTHSLVLTASRISGSLTCGIEVIMDSQPAALSVLADDMSVGRDATFFGSLNGSLNLRGSHIGGSLHLGATQSEQLRLIDRVGLRLSRTIDLTDVNIEHALKIGYGYVRSDLSIDSAWVKTPTIKSYFTPLPFYGNADARLIRSYLQWHEGQITVVTILDRGPNFPKTTGTGAAQAATETKAGGASDEADEAPTPASTERFVVLDGSSSAIHATNLHFKLALDASAGIRSRYLEFFCDNVWGREGHFRIVGSDEDFSDRIPEESWISFAPRIWSRWVNRKLKGEVAKLSKTIAKNRIENGQENKEKNGETILVRGVEYGNQLFAAAFKIHESRLVEMVEDEHVASLKPGSGLRFRPPVRELPDPGKLTDFNAPSIDELEKRCGLSGPWIALSAENTDQASVEKIIIERKNELLPEATRRKAASHLSLRLDGATVDVLSDGHGGNWSLLDSFKLSLRGLHVSRVLDSSGVGVFTPGSPPRSSLSWLNWWKAFRWTERWQGLDSRASRRLVWLSHQYETPADPLANGDTHPPEHILQKDAFSPEPYLLFAGLARKYGFFEAGDQIHSYGRTTEYRAKPNGKTGWWGSLKSWLTRCWHYFEWVGFNYYQSIFRAYRAVCLYWLLGVGATWLGQHFNLLVVDTPPPAVSAKNDNGELVLLVPVLAPSATAVSQLSCEGEINPLTYPLDIMISIVDLGQKEKCSITMEAETYLGWAGLVLLGLLQALYAIFGWVVLSMAIITATNATRRGQQS